MRRHLLRRDVRRYRDLLGLTRHLLRVLLAHQGQYQGGLADAALADQQYPDVAPRRDRALHHAAPTIAFDDDVQSFANGILAPHLPEMTTEYNITCNAAGNAPTTRRTSLGDSVSR